MQAAAGDLLADAARAWMSTDFQQRMEKFSGTYFVFDTWSIDSVEQSPGGDEAIARGHGHATSKWIRSNGSGYGPGVDEEVKFSILVSKEKGGDRWRVETIEYEEPPPKKSP
jgi:hypothetical protein